MQTKYCDICGEKLAFIKPLNTCVLVEDYRMTTYCLCRACFDNVKRVLESVRTDAGDEQG
mgnify:CR=1 FL=1